MLILTACLLPARSAVGLCLAAADSVTDGQAIVDEAIAVSGAQEADTFLEMFDEVLAQKN